MKRVLTSIWFLAFIIALPVILFLPPVFEKYNVKMLQKGKRILEDNSKIYLEDLDMDGSIERILSFNLVNKGNTFSIQFFGEDGGMIEQTNFPFKYSNSATLQFADFNNDGNKETYTFSFERDSIILNWIQITPTTGKINSLPICKVNYYNDSLLDYSIHRIHCVDLENDGNNELVFAVNGGYSYSPRQIFKVDIKNRIVSASRNTGSASGPIHFYDLDKDGKLEIIAEGQVAPVRDWFNLEMNEPAPYLKVFDSNLNYFFPPIKFYNGIQSSIQTFVSDKKGENELIATFSSSSVYCIPFRVYKINLRGEITDSLVYPSKSREIAKYVLKNKDGNLISQVEPSVLLEYNVDMEIVKLHKLKSIGNLTFLAQSDINEDGIDELFFLDSQNKLNLYSDKLKWFSTFSFEGTVQGRNNVKLRKNQFYVVDGPTYYIYSFIKNPFYILRVPVFLGIYFFCVLLVFLFQKIIELRLKEKYELKNQVRELQLQSFRNRLNPHFIFNTFNGIASVLKKGDSEKAYEVFMRFSKLTRHVLENFDEDFIPLKLELELVYNYIELQKFRYKELFNYEIKVGDIHLNDFPVPGMIIQIHVENAIIHGLIPKDENGFLQVIAEKENEWMKIVIQDNGIGREKAGKLNNDKHGIGLKSIDGIIANINYRGKQKITQKITDLKDSENQACGTRVEIIIFRG